MDASLMAESIEDIEIQLLLDAVYRHYHYDFRHYARASIKRRLLQARSQWGYDSISDIQSAVLHDESILPKLLNFLIYSIMVANGFRSSLHAIYSLITFLLQESRFSAA